MKTVAKQMLKSVRIIILVVFVVLSLIAIHPDPTTEGVAIRSVARNSSASLAGMESPKPTSTPMSKERVVSINNEPVLDLKAYTDIVSEFMPNRTVQIKTTEGFYQLVTS
jgi:S1-C subfamily serine protease